MKSKIIAVAIIFVILVFAGGYAYYTVYERSPERIYSKNKNTVVFIAAYDFGGTPIKFGSGFIVDKNGTIATNYHVINDAGDIVIKTIDDRILAVEAIKYFDEEKDLALIKIKKSKEYELTAVDIGDSEKMVVGEKVYTIGNPKGLESTFSEGNVSGVRQWKQDVKVIQITAPLSPGSSGGPVLDKHGRAVGLSTFILMEGQNLNFAIPFNYIKNEITKPQIAYTLMPKEPAWNLFHSVNDSDRYLESWDETFVDTSNITTIDENLKGVWISTRTRYGEQKAPYPINVIGAKPHSTTKTKYGYVYCDCVGKTITTLLLGFTLDDKGTITPLEKRVVWKDLLEKFTADVNEQRKKLQKAKDDLIIFRSSAAEVKYDTESAILEKFEKSEAEMHNLSSRLIGKVCNIAD